MVSASISHRRPAPSSPVFLLALLALVSGCHRKGPPNPDVWAEVDGKPILRQQVERYYRTRMAAGADAPSPEQALSLQLNILHELINNQILIAHASRSKITASEAEVDTKVNELQSPYSKEEFQKKLLDQGMQLGDFRNDVRQSLLITKLINKEILARITVTDSEVRDYYERNKATFNIPETEYHLAQILVTPKADFQVRNMKGDDARNPQAAERKIQALYARVRSGENFATVAQSYSEDPRTAAGGGDMGFIPVSALNSSPQLKQTLSSLTAGQTTGILRDSEGYHIIKLLGREAAGQRELSDPQVQNAIRQTLRNEREQLLKAAYIEDLRNRAKVINYLGQKIAEAGGNAALLK